MRQVAPNTSPCNGLMRLASLEPHCSTLYLLENPCKKRAEPAVSRIFVIARMPALIDGEGYVIQWEGTPNKMRHPLIDLSAMPGDCCDEIGPFQDRSDLKPVCHGHNRL